METNPSLLEGFLGRVTHEEKDAIFANEYVILFRRGNYLIEGNPSPKNRGIILIVFSFHINYDLPSLSL